MDLSVLVNGFISLATIATAIISVRVGIRQIRQEESQKLIKFALFENHLQEQQKAIDKAHDKIRELDSKNTETSVCIAELKQSMQENTRVLRQVESALMVLSKIEERLNGHIEAERN